MQLTTVQREGTSLLRCSFGLTGFALALWRNVTLGSRIFISLLSSSRKYL